MLIKNVNKIVLPSTRSYTKVLTKDTISERVTNTDFAVKGAIPLRGEEIQREIAGGQSFPFPSTVSLNIGNPHAIG